MKTSEQGKKILTLINQYDRCYGSLISQANRDESDETLHQATPHLVQHGMPLTHKCAITLSDFV